MARKRFIICLDQNAMFLLCNIYNEPAVTNEPMICAKMFQRCAAEHFNEVCQFDREQASHMSGG